ncbi:AAA family ATPase [Marinospirillum insulare]|uniref:ATPase dynein-related AAA domain-containing protein n=1 Tax=Marinospirillum insulare TaxID=217169 RepID=A0ABQ5ZVW3_9GAMM|nr:AAA family ATPase [Marinospirillum insulare]GLR62806.1 hypothetical protein GCM10007878_02410 [Marinospirillum insulare]
MGKTNGNKPNQKLVPMWKSSFQNASKVYQANKKDLEIAFDEEWLQKVLEALQRTDESSAVARWIERFADVCKELGKYQEKLDEEVSNRWEQANNLGLENESEKEQLSEERAKLEAERGSLDQQGAELETRELELAKQKNELLDKERLLKTREFNAESGFALQNEQALKQMEAKQKELTEQQEASLEELQDQKRDLMEEIRKAEQKLASAKVSYSEAELDRVSQLDEQEAKLREEKASLSKKRTRLDMEWGDLNFEKEALKETLANEMEKEREAHKTDLAKITSQRNKAWETVQALREQLFESQELTNIIGEQTPGEFIESNESLKNENRELKRKLEDSDTAELESENEHLRQRNADLERDINDLRPKLDQASRELSLNRVAATEQESIAREKRVLESHKNTLSVHIDDLESRIDQLTNAHKANTAFPAMSQMDSEKAFQATIELEHVPKLEDFAKQLRHRIARAETSVELYYPLEDIRVLIAGLAMSKLHVFQGISGTGKTSLAKAFAKAMGGFCTDIAVQAGWRDRDDLLGHFNAFERKFYEKDCLQALYRAQTPRWSDTCNVVLLDEMNLSRPEQYFSEFLSALEKNDPRERLISLSETALPGAPKMLIEGRQIIVPDNVWFIGTANHDETTNELADKTYDRSHVMTLPKQDHRFDPKDYVPKQFSFRSLQRAFDKACEENKSSVQGLLDELAGSSFTEHLESDFGLGWGNRFEKQALRFMPVMLETGATISDALDHLLATRIMRQGKVTGRFDVAQDDVTSLLEKLEGFWNHANLEGLPEKSIDLLEKDIKRKESGF